MNELEALLERGVLEPLDVELARALARHSAALTGTAALLVALTSRATREGHVCLDLAELAETRLRDEQGALHGEPLPSLAELRSALLASGVVVEVARSTLGDAVLTAPLVLDEGGRLYLQRYFEHERELGLALRARARFMPVHDDPSSLREALERVFPRRDGEVDRQRLAAELAVLLQLVVVTGGPGTGKTTTVVRLLAVLIEAALTREQAAPRVLLLAPTGKAAARLVEAIGRAKAQLPVPERVRAAIPDVASTIHRALGVVPGRVGFRHDARRPLPYDFVLVDEASMVDVALMRRLFDAVAPTTRLALLGDRDQLASVEAGAVLADVCAGAATRGRSQALAARYRRVFGAEFPLPLVVAGAAPDGTHPDGARWHDAHPDALGELPAFADVVVELRQSHRFSAEKGVGLLAAAIQRGDVDAAIAALASERTADVALVPRRQEPALGPALRRLVVEGFAPFLATRVPEEALRRFDAFRVLAAHRRGTSGVELLNRLVEQALESERLLRRDSRFYTGRPILVTENDARLGLYNGDVGVCLPGADGEPRVWFGAAGGELRGIAPARLPPHETTFVMSVHKSQGSEVDVVAVVLPDERSPLLGRELLYTAVTRARSRALLVGQEAAVRAAVARSTRRTSGLGGWLWS